MKRILPIVLVLLGAVSCKKDTFQPIDCQYFVEVTAEQRFTFDQLIEQIKLDWSATIETVDSQRGVDEILEANKDDIEMLRMAAKQYTAYSIKYRTVDPFGKDIIASGVIYYPSVSKLKGVIEICSRNAYKGGCGTLQPLQMELMACMSGYVALMADLVGCGTTADMPIEALQYGNIARVSADLREAAREFIHNRFRRTLPRGARIFGYSLAGGAALELARFYEQHPERSVNVIQTFAGGGIYDPVPTLEEVIRSGTNPYALTPLLLYSINHYAGLGIDMAGLFKGELAAHADEWASGGISTYEILVTLGENLADYIDMAVFKKGEPAYDRIMEAADKLKIPADWTPKSPVFLFHAKDDSFVPRLSADALAERWKAAGADVQYTVYDTDLHLDTFFLMEVDFVQQLP